ncbi:MAG TPA: DUF559 domain-containing protein [Microbacteriaceae bacterium]|nr:DUF559 domain-containing protein [Microbacteriaceae bacterium]
MTAVDWITSRGGVVHRTDLIAAGYDPRRLGALRLNRAWYATANAPPELLAAARVSGRIACATAAAHLGLALLHPPRALHLWVPGHAKAGRRNGVRLHRAAPLVPRRRGELVIGAADVLEHVAICLPHDEALIVWESACSKGVLTAAQCRRIAWRPLAARRLAHEVTDLADSLLETLVAIRLRELGVAYQQQVKLLGHRVDFLIGARLVVQVDGYAFHSDARQRREDLEHDARLTLEGYIVIRVAYRDVVHTWPATEARLMLALAQGLHRGRVRA